RPRARRAAGSRRAPVHALLHHPQRGHGPGLEPVPHGDRAARRRPRLRPRCGPGRDWRGDRIPVYPSERSRAGGARGRVRCTARRRTDHAMTFTTDPRLGLPTAYLVDAADVVRDALAWLLRSRRLLSEGFASAEAFEAMLATRSAGWPTSPACLLLDVRMPGTSGLVLFERLAERGLLDSPPVIFLTGHGDVPTAVAAVKRGAFDFVEKPFADNALVDRVEQALAVSTQTLALRREGEGVRKRLAELTERERDVMRLVVEGRPN